MKLTPRTSSGKAIYALFFLGLLGYVARLLSAPEWVDWVLFVPFVVLGVWTISLLWRGE